MNWFLVINDTKCRKELQQFIERNAASIVFRSKTINDSGATKRKQGKERIIINSTNNVQVIKVDDILYCQSNHSYTQFHLNNGKTIVATKTLKQYETSLNKKQFVRIHQSHLVNINYIDKYVKGEGGHLVLTNGTKLPVATRKREYLLRELEKL